MSTLLAIAGGLVLLGGGAAVVQRLFRVWRRVSQFIDRVVGIPEQFGLPAQPGILERLDNHERLMQEMHHELHPNGGSSMRDAIDRTEHKLDDHQRKLDEHIDLANEVHRQGAAAEEEIRGTIATLAEAVKIAAQSTPPPEEGTT